jgi:VanZ family protein
MSRIIKFLRRWSFTLVMMIIIFVSSSIPADEMPNFSWADMLVKKSGHFLVYSLLAIACWYGFAWQRDRLWHAWILTFFYAVLDEFHQSFVPGRHPWWVDVAIDSLAAAFVLLVFNWWRERKNKSG